MLSLKIKIDNDNILLTFLFLSGDFRLKLQIKHLTIFLDRVKFLVHGTCTLVHSLNRPLICTSKFFQILCMFDLEFDDVFLEVFITLIQLFTFLNQGGMLALEHHIVRRSLDSGCREKRELK